VAKDDVIGGNFAKRLRQRTYRKCRHRLNAPFAGMITRMH